MEPPAAAAITLEQRALWQKAVSFPEQLTADERQEICDEPDIATRNANILNISGLTPEEFMDKAEQDPNSLTEAEFLLIQTKFHIRTLKEHVELNRLRLGWRVGLSKEDNQLRGDAYRSVYDPRVLEIQRSISIISTDRAKARAPNLEAFKMAPKWVRKVEGLESWGFVAFRGSSIMGSSEDWEKYYRGIQGRASGGFVLVGGPINRTKGYDWGERDIDDSDQTGLLRAFDKKRKELKPGFLNNTFIVFDKECTQPYMSNPNYTGYMNPQEKPWAWAYDANFVPDSSLSSKSIKETYQGRLRVRIHCLFTWFYAVRESELYTMERLWEMAQTQPDKAWFADSIGGAYHHQLVLPLPGEDAANLGVYHMEL